jgi:hypothetical protein
MQAGRRIITIARRTAKALSRPRERVWVRVFFLLPSVCRTRRRKKTLTFPPPSAVGPFLSRRRERGFARLTGRETYSRPVDRLRRSHTLAGGRIAAVRRNFAGPLVIGRDVMEV